MMLFGRLRCFSDTVRLAIPRRLLERADRKRFITPTSVLSCAPDPSSSSSSKSSRSSESSITDISERFSDEEVDMTPRLTFAMRLPDCERARTRKTKSNNKAPRHTAIIACTHDIVSSCAFSN
jgi:hypothetical protein